MQHHALHDLCEGRIGFAFTKHHTQHRQPAIFCPIDKMRFQRITHTVQCMLGGRMKMKLLQLETTPPDGSKIAR